MDWEKTVEADQRVQGRIHGAVERFAEVEVEEDEGGKSPVPLRKYRNTKNLIFGDRQPPYHSPASCIGARVFADPRPSSAFATADIGTFSRRSQRLLRGANPSCVACPCSTSKAPFPDTPTS